MCVRFTSSDARECVRECVSEESIRAKDKMTDRDRKCVVMRGREKVIEVD